MKTCSHCSSPFKILQEDKDFYEKISPIFGGVKYSISEPRLCPECRAIRRLSWRNERKLYWRTCDATGEQILTVFHPDKKYKVYDYDYWYTDNWDAKDYGRDFDFSRPFFEQFNELLHEVPQLSRSATGNQNCDYTNQIGWCKDCYMCFELTNSEGLMYAGHTYNSKSSVDVGFCSKVELCYQTVDCVSCYGCFFSQDSINCSNSWFLKNCSGCRNCFGCVNLKNKEYCIFNKQYTKEQYKEEMQKYDFSNYENLKNFQKQFREFVLQFPQKYIRGTQNEDVTGDYIYNSRKCDNCFGIENSEFCKNLWYVQNAKYSHDTDVFGATDGMEWCYENHEIGEGVKNVCFSDQIWGASYDIFYSKLCIANSHHLFGCIGMKHDSYCILNKQYSKEEYEELVPKIIEHMKSTGEWGEFSPTKLSPFAYNETVAQEYFPLSKEEVESKGWRWREQEDSVSANKQIPAERLPHRLDDVPDDILNWAIVCERTKRPFKIIKQELEFYRRHRLPIPHLHPDERHKDQMALRNPRKLYERNCNKCQKEIQTSYAPNRPEIVYCKECYLAEVY